MEFAETIAQHHRRIGQEELGRSVITHMRRVLALRIQGVIDRNVIRVAVYEMLHCMDVPPVVSINEAVDIAKYFGTAESGRFVNGVLDRICKSLERPSRTAE